MPGILDWIATNLPHTPIARGILSARENEFMMKYRKQLMDQQQQAAAQTQQQQGAAKSAWESFPDQALVTPQVTSPNQLQQNREAIAGHDWGLLNNVPSNQRPIWKAFSDADPLGALQQLGQQARATPQETFRNFGPGSDPLGQGGAGQVSTTTGGIQNYQKPQTTPAGQTPNRQLTADELKQWGFPEGTVASIDTVTNTPSVHYKPDIRERTDLDQRSQQGGTFLTPAGDIVAGEFLPNQGYGSRDKSGKWTPFPDGTRPVTPSTGGFWSPKEFTQKRQEFLQEQQALNRLNEYGKSVGGMNVGLKNWADSVTAKFRTALGSKELNPAEFARMTGEGQLQALLGLFRTDVVGPGVMTEFDAQRVLQALGGNIGMLQNPQVVQQLLTQLYSDKMQRLQLLEADIRRNSVPFGTEPMQITAPPDFTGTGAPPAPGQGLSPEEQSELEQLRRELGGQ